MAKGLKQFSKQVSYEEIGTIVKQSVAETLAALGFNLAELHEIQADLHYLRRKRLLQQAMIKRSWQQLVTMTVPFVVYAIWLFLKVNLISS